MTVDVHAKEAWERIVRYKFVSKEDPWSNFDIDLARIERAERNYRLGRR